MGINRYNMIRYSGVVAVAMAVVVSFQNCGQAGQIAEVQLLESVANLPTPDGEVITTPNGSYRDFSKAVNIKATQDTLDVLVVVDNSGSMSFEQSNMATRFASFLTQLRGLNWRVAITTTHVADTDSETINEVNNVADGKILRMGTADPAKHFISSADSLMEAQALFSSTIQRRETGSGNEQGIRATYRALERARDTNSVNSTFFRNDAALSVIVVSDANETPYSRGVNRRNLPENLLAYVTQIFPAKAFSFHSVIVRNNDTDCLRFPNSGNEGFGTSYQSLSLGTSGIVGSVCELDYGTQLAQIGQSSAELVKNVSLECLPSDSDNNKIPDVKIVNNLNPAVELQGYKVEGNQLQFDVPLAAGDYTVSYKCFVPATTPAAAVQ